MLSLSLSLSMSRGEIPIEKPRATVSLDVLLIFHSYTELKLSDPAFDLDIPFNAYFVIPRNLRQPSLTLFSPHSSSAASESCFAPASGILRTAKSTI